ncbi:hypothetical protein D3C81_1628420 [compost metagenome]
MAVAREQRVEGILLGLRLAIVARGQRQTHFAPAAAQEIDDLVLENADQPRAQRRLARKALRVLQRGQQGLGNGVFGERLVAQLQPGKAQQIGPHGLEFGGIEAHCGGGIGRAGAEVLVVFARAARFLVKSAPARQSQSGGRIRHDTC